MAYSVDGKIYTDHALMDEIVFALKKIFKEIVIKNDFLADQMETQLSVDNFDIEKLKQLGNLTFDNFPFTAAYYLAYGYSTTLVENYLNNRYEMSVGEREPFLQFCIKFYEDNFEEVNDYYRTLAGQPPYNTGSEYFITYNGDGNKPGYGSFLPAYFRNNPKAEIDETLPLHRQKRNVINVLQTTGGIDALREIYKGSKYSYILHLGSKSIDWFTARMGSKYDILYFPKVERIIEDRFKEIYIANRDIYLARTYQDAYKYESDYYEQEMILMILCQTFTDIVAEIPEWYIRRDIFDLRTVKYFLDSYSVDYFPEIPLKYQIRIVKNLNTLIKYKSSNKNNLDIVKIFDMPDAKFYKYYLFKRRRLQGENYIHSTVNDKNFELQFIKTVQLDNYDNFIKDNIYQVPYNDLTLEDKYWDGETLHNTVRKDILKKEFTIEGSKYMSVEFEAPMPDYQDQMQFFLGTILNNNFDMDDFTVVIPTISEDAELRVSDLFLLLIAMTDIYEASEQVLRYPDQDMNPWDVEVDEDFQRFFMDLNGGYAGSEELDYDKFVDGNIKYQNTTASWWITGDGGQVKYSTIKSLDEFNTWMKYWYDPVHTGDNTIHPWMYEARKAFICAFNEVDLNKLEEIVSQRHSRYGFERGYTLEELGVANYISPSELIISSADDLIAYYRNNMEIYHQLKERMAGRHYRFDEEKTEVINSMGYDEHKVLEFVFNTLFTKEFDTEFYTLTNGELATNFGQILLERDFILYDVYNKIKTTTNKETQRDYIRNIMNDIINTLEWYLHGEGLEYIFSFTAIASFYALLRYIYLVVCFFKSWKVHFIDPYVTFKMNDIVENNAGALDGLREIKEEYHKPDRLYTADLYTMNDTQWIKDDVQKDNMKELLGVSVHYEPDPFDDYDYDGMKPENDSDDFKMADGAYPDDHSQVPYKMLNGGNPQQGMFGAWDLNGYGPKEFAEEYIDINGGYPYDPDEDRTDWFGTLGFNYIIDGGDVTFADFFGRDIRLDLHDHQVYADVRVSTKMYNVLKVEHEKIPIYEDDMRFEYGDMRDGSYIAAEDLIDVDGWDETNERIHHYTDEYDFNELAQVVTRYDIREGLSIKDDWVSMEDFTSFVNMVSDEYGYYTDLYSYLLWMIEQIYDEKRIDETIANIVNKYTKVIIDTSRELTGDVAENKIKAYVDALVREAYARYEDVTALSTWGELPEAVSNTDS